MRIFFDDNAPQIKEVKRLNSVQLTEIYPQIYPKRPFSPNQINSHFHRILESNGRIWTIIQSGTPIGYAAIYPVPGLPKLVEIEGGIIPSKQRQGFASQLLQHIMADVKNSPTQQISHSVTSLKSPAAKFLQNRNFFIAHEELHLQLNNLQSHQLTIVNCQLSIVNCQRETAVSTFPILYDQSFAGTRWYQPYSSDEIEVTLAPNDEMLYCLHQDMPIGFAWIRYPSTTTAEIEPIGIVKEMQGKGYGRFFFQAILHKLQQQGMQQVQIGVWAENEIARNLYHKFGFRQQSTTTYLAYNL